MDDFGQRGFCQDESACTYEIDEMGLFGIGCLDLVRATWSESWFEDRRFSIRRTFNSLCNAQVPAVHYWCVVQCSLCLLVSRQICMMMGVASEVTSRCTLAATSGWLSFCFLSSA